MTKQTIYTSEAPDPIGAYSQGVITGNILFVSGQIGLDPTKMELRDSFSSQAKQVFSNLSAILDEAGTNLEEILKLTVFLTDLDNFSVLNEIMIEMFQKPFPARSVVETSRLPKDALLEIEAIAKV